MVRVGEDQEILTLSEPLQFTKEVLPETSKHHYGAEPSFHRSASVCKPALVLVRAYITPRTRLKPPYRAFKGYRKGKHPIYSQPLLDYLCRCLLCTDTPVIGLIQFCAGVTKPSTHKKDGNWLLEALRTKEGFILYLQYVYNHLAR